MDAPEFDVADAFKKPDRSAALAGRLSTRPARQRPDPSPAQQGPVQAAEEPAPPEAAPESTPTPREPQNAPTPRRRTSPRSAGPGSDGRLVVALPIGLRDRARAHASSRGETYLDVALAAVQETHDQLPERVAARHEEDTPTPAATEGLFEHQPRRRKAPEATAQVTIRGLSQHDRSVLETLVDTTGAANLTELLTVALDAHLPQRPRSLR